MSSAVPDEQAENVPSRSSGEVIEEALPSGDTSESDDTPGGPQITFQGNIYDLASLGSLITGVLILFLCLTCNMGYYCLPLVPVALGAIGVLSARQSVEAERTKLWSWIGIAAGGILLLLIVAVIVLYIGFIVLAITVGERG